MFKTGQKFCHECGSPIRTVKADKEPKCEIPFPEFDIDDSLEYLDAVKFCFRQLELDNSYAATLKYAELLQELEENSEALEDEDHEDYWMFSNTVAKLLERFKRAKKDFIDVLTLDNFVKA